MPNRPNSKVYTKEQKELVLQHSANGASVPLLRELTGIPHIKLEAILRELRATNKIPPVHCHHMINVDGMTVGLTDRELTVLRRLKQGASLKDISQELYGKPTMVGRVNNCLQKQIYFKFGVETLEELTEILETLTLPS